MKRFAAAFAVMVLSSPLYAALKPGVPIAWRHGAFAAALATFAYIASVAITKQPLGLLRLF